VLGTSLKRRVETMAQRHMRTLGREIVYLCALALRAPVSPPEDVRGDLLGDEPKSGITYMAYDPAIDMLVVERIRRTQESISQAVRTLLRHGIAIQDQQDGPGRSRSQI